VVEKALDTNARENSGGLFYNAFSITDYIASVGRMTKNKWERILKEGSWPN
jgi:hypothetical protein